MQEIDALPIVNLPVQIYPVVAGQAVLCNHHRDAVAAVDVHGAVVHDLRGHVPLAGRQWEAGMELDHRSGFIHHGSLVDIDADEVRGFHLFPVFSGNGGGEFLHRCRGRVVILL